MATQKANADPGALERQDRRQERQSTYRKVGTYALVTAVVAVVAAVAFALQSNSRTPDAATVGQPPASVPAVSAPASAAPDGVGERMCSDGARSRLELTDMGDRIKVRFEVHESPVGHEWRIHFRHVDRNITPVLSRVFFRGTQVASDSGGFVVQLRYPDWPRRIGLVGKAVDGQTGQVCNVRALFGDY